MTDIQILALVASCAVVGALIIGAVYVFAFLSLRGLEPENWDD